jgi:integrase
VFHRAGKPLDSIRTAWRTAVDKAGLPGLRPHDLKRSAIRNMIRAGLPERIAMDLTGHRTRSMHDRYNVSSPSDLAENTARLAAYLDRPTVTVRSQRRG